MDLELATMKDIIHELRQRQLPFVLVGVEPSNRRKVTVQVGASGEDLHDVVRLLRLGRDVLESRNPGSSDEGMSDL